MLPLAFQTTMAVGKLQQTHALDRVATGIGTRRV
jgi:hypothetical protein